MKIVIVDYGIGNIQSIFNALNQFKNIEIILSDNRSEILASDGVILPGVGAFRKAMEELTSRDLPNILKDYIKTKKPLLGICLGMQLLLESSQEFGETIGLGIIEGTVEHFPSTTSNKLPHIGWNTICQQKIGWNDTIFQDISTEDSFYFVHSYICKPKDEGIILSKSEYGGVEFCSSIQKDNIYACQFHPEKSAKSGINVMKNFIEIVKKG